MEWTIRLEAKTGWGEVETVEVVRPRQELTARACSLQGRSV
jgi:hypothetical protein